METKSVLALLCGLVAARSVMWVMFFFTKFWCLFVSVLQTVSVVDSWC